jgi:DNA-binding transcriptional ArsR family regulator
MHETDALAALAALSQNARLRVFRALLGAMLDIPGSTLSFHLKELVQAGLVSAEREGRHLHYRPQMARMDALIAYLTDHCCLGEPCLPSVKKQTLRC